MAKQDSDNLVCTLIQQKDQNEKDIIWKELKDSFINRSILRNGYRLRFKAPPFLLEKMGRFILLERTCCQFLHIRLDVPPPSVNQEDIMDISLIGQRGVKKVLDPALTSMGFGSSERSNSWMKLGSIGVAFSILCCTLPFVFVAFSMPAIASIFVSLDSAMWVIFPLSVLIFLFGVYKKRKASKQCGTNC